MMNKHLFSCTWLIIFLGGGWGYFGGFVYCGTDYHHLLQI